MEVMRHSGRTDEEGQGTMKIKLMRAVMASTALAAIMLGSQGAQAATGTANATATVLTVIQVVANTGLDFGTVVPSAAAGTTVINTAGVRTCSPTVGCATSDIGNA